MALDDFASFEETRFLLLSISTPATSCHFKWSARVTRTLPRIWHEERADMACHVDQKVLRLMDRLDGPHLGVVEIGLRRARLISGSPPPDRPRRRTVMSGSPLAQRANLAFIFAILVLIFVGGYAYRALEKSGKTEWWVWHTHQVLESIQLLRLDVANERSSVRRYVVSGDQPDLAAFGASAARAEGNAAAIRDLTVDNPRQQQRIAALEQVLEQQHHHSQTIVDLSKAHGVGAVIDLVQTGLGRKINGQFESIVGQMRDEELRLLALRNARTKRALDQTRAMLLFGSLVSLVVATVASWSVQRESKRRAHAEADLLQKVEQLIRSNAELENFTKIAAHDLQEPLRSVSSHLQLLSRRYKGRLDAEADQFIGFAVSGASRMKQLIQDLLAYAHIGATDQVLLATSSDDALQQASINLHGAIVESGALVTHDVLPEVMANPAQLIQLFQNLVGNAIKYQHPGTPRVHIAAVKHGAKRWIFAVTDNGLGIKPQYFEKIFGLFERLHGPEEFSGTGIGLPICKKIIELHDGDLSVESQFGHGSTFRFSLAGTE